MIDESKIKYLEMYSSKISMEDSEAISLLLRIYKSYSDYIVNIDLIEQELENQYDRIQENEEDWQNDDEWIVGVLYERYNFETQDMQNFSSVEEDFAYALEQLKNDHYIYNDVVKLFISTYFNLPMYGSEDILNFIEWIEGKIHD